MPGSVKTNNHSCLLVGLISMTVLMISITVSSLPTNVKTLKRIAPHAVAVGSKIREPRSADTATVEDELSVSNLTPQEILQLLVMRYNDRIHHEPRARMILDELTEKDISEICGTSASLKCGRDVLMTFDEEAGDVEERCNIRKTFLNCIDETRKECKVLAKTGIFPILPSKSEVAKFQGKVWRALWTSGGCLLSN